MTIFTSHLVVGISGKAGHGKDSVATIIEKQLMANGQQSAIVRLADALKDAYSTMFSLNRDDLEKLEFKLQTNHITGTTHREELQYLGTEAYRNRVKNPDVWIQVLCDRLKQYYGEAIFPALIPDVRFENEARFAINNGVLIRVERPGQADTVNSGHQSEAGFTTIPHLTIINDGDLSKLEESCKAATSLILLKYSTYKQVIKDTKIATFM